MRLGRLLTLLFSIFLIAAGSASATPLGKGAIGRSTVIVPAPAFTNTQLRSLPNGDWITNGGNIYNQRYSPLDQINTTNVPGLQAAWHTHLDNSRPGQKDSDEG